MSFLSRSLVPLVLAVCLQACVSQNAITDVEKASRPPATSTDMSRVLNHGIQVADGYLALSGQAETAQDVAFWTTLGIAGFAAVGAVDSISASQLAYAGIAGLSVNQITNYYNPRNTRQALITAADRQMCIVRSTVGLGLGQVNSPAATQLVRASFTRNSIRLRNSIVRTRPTYEEVVAQLENEKSAAANNREAVGGLGDGIVNAERLQELGAALETCFTPQPAPSQ